jgi:hypothetical protein
LIKADQFESNAYKNSNNITIGQSLDLYWKLSALQNNCSLKTAVKHWN